MRFFPSSFSFVSLWPIALGLALCGSAKADDRETCKAASGDIAIKACTRAIASKKYKGNVLSLLYTNRGVEFGEKGEMARALKDHDEAIKVDPNNALAFNNRGIVKLKKGDKEGGEADIAKAKQLQPSIGEPQTKPADDRADDKEMRALSSHGVQ